MTKVSFYVLGDGAGPLDFVCRLVDRIHRQQQPVYVHCAAPAQAQHLDELLWTWREGSFLPHEQYRGGEPEAPLLLGCDEPPVAPRCVLINLSQDVPEFFSSFDRCVELVAGDVASREASRERYRYYRDRGYELESHQIAD